jgi:hypothetical protein
MLDAAVKRRPAKLALLVPMIIVIAVAATLVATRGGDEKESLYLLPSWMPQGFSLAAALDDPIHRPPQPFRPPTPEATSAITYKIDNGAQLVITALQFRDPADVTAPDSMFPELGTEPPSTKAGHRALHRNKDGRAADVGYFWAESPHVVVEVNGTHVSDDDGEKIIKSIKRVDHDHWLNTVQPALGRR